MLALLLAWFIIRSAMRKLGADPGKAAEVARRVASGDLQFDLPAGTRRRTVSLMGALRQMKDSLLHSKLDYEGQINAIAKVQGVIECTPEGERHQRQRNLPQAHGLRARGREGQELLDVRRRTGDRETLWQALQRGESRQGEFRIVTRDKREVWVRGVFNPIVDAHGKPFKVVAYLNDVTQARQEAILNAAFRGALNRLDANVMVADNDLKIIFVNPAAAKMLDARAGILPQGSAGLRRRQSSWVRASRP